MPDLGSTISLNASGFAVGVAQTRAKLVELNTALIENRNKMKEVNKEAQELQKQEKALTAAMKDDGTKEQQQELEHLDVLFVVQREARDYYVSAAFLAAYPAHKAVYIITPFR